MRIAVGGIHTECSTYSPVLMKPEDFRVLSGQGLIESDYFAFLKTYPQAQIVPLFHARAVPGGPLARETYDGFKAEFMAQLKAALPLDAVYLAMHGAMKVDGMFDAEGDWISAVRQIVGPDMLIATSYDLHGNVSQKIIDQIDIFAAYRTAPHIDTPQTMQAAFAMLMRALQTGAHPFVARVPLPLLLPGERSSTEDEPAKSLYAALPALDVGGVWRADLMIGYVWADEPRAGATAIVTGTDPLAVISTAEKIGTDFWAQRDAFAFGPTTGPLAEMLDIAAQTSSRPIILADSGDNPTGGGVGDRADVLAALIERDWQDALIAGITDRPAVEAALAAGIGAEVDLTIGASLDPAGGQVRTKAKVIHLHQDPLDAQAVVQIGAITVVLAARRRPYHNIADFTLLGLDPSKVALLVVKSGYLSPDLAPLANPNLMALTDGVVNQDIPRLTNLHRPQGTMPWQDNPDFIPRATLSARAKV